MVINYWDCHCEIDELDALLVTRMVAHTLEISKLMFWRHASDTNKLQIEWTVLVLRALHTPKLASQPASQPLSVRIKHNTTQHTNIIIRLITNSDSIDRQINK